MRFNDMIDLSSSVKDIPKSSISSGIRRVSYLPETEGYKEDQKTTVSQQMGFGDDPLTQQKEDARADAEIKQRVMDENIDVLSSVFTDKLREKAVSVGFDKFLSIIDNRESVHSGIDVLVNHLFGQAMDDTVMENPETSDITSTEGM